MFYAFAVIFGIGFGGRNPLTTSIRGEYFGRGNFGKILGISTIPMNGLLLISSPFAGYMYDWTGTYTVAFLVLAGFNSCRAASASCSPSARKFRPPPRPRPRSPPRRQPPLPETTRSGFTCREERAFTGCPIRLFGRAPGRSQPGSHRPRRLS